jgi:hypothetical protein
MVEVLPGVQFADPLLTLTTILVEVKGIVLKVSFQEDQTHPAEQDPGGSVF